MICSSVVQRALHAPALWDSLGFSMGWKLPALSLLDRHRAPSRRPRGRGIREISNCCKKNIHPFFFFVVLTAQLQLDQEWGSEGNEARLLCPSKGKFQISVTLSWYDFVVQGWNEYSEMWKQ